MDMVIHQTIGPDFERVLAPIAGKQLQVGQSVFIIKKDAGAIIAPLSDMMRVARGYYAGDSWHGRMLVHDPMKGNINMGSVPSF
jgi:hypothetical protein